MHRQQLDEFLVFEIWLVNDLMNFGFEMWFGERRHMQVFLEEFRTVIRTRSCVNLYR